MRFVDHSHLKGRHAVLSGSKHHWVNYSEEKFLAAWERQLAAKKGAELHEFAQRCIVLGIKLPNSQQTLNQYVNDGIGFKMTPEQILMYSRNCFGCADTISFRSGLLRIHDLKTGIIPGNMNQLMIYSALFCLEYQENPTKIEIELRIYQGGEVLIHCPSDEEVSSIMAKIVLFDKIIEEHSSGG